MSSRHRLRLAAVTAMFLVITTVSGLLAAPPVAAHTHVMQGEYELTVRWRVEPSIVCALNGLDLGIQDHLTNGTVVYVVGVEMNLTATLSTGQTTKMYALSPQDDRPGWYTFDVIPTVAGGYSVKLVGALNTTAINVTVPLDVVAQASDYQFPLTEPGATDLQNSITALNAQLATLQTLLTVLVAVSVLAVLLGAASLAFTIRAARVMKRSP